ncbi:SYNG1 protein, partial [Amia calva]|nr:SYNG1 protein [Amia calva]
LPPLSWRSNCPPQELLDPCALPSALQPFYPPPMLWGDPHTLGLHRKEYLETAFVDVPPPPSPLGHGLLLRGGGSVAGTSGADVVSVSCSLEDEDDLLPDYEDSSSECLSDSDSESSFSLLIPQDHLGLAVFSMLCCFWPLGIAAFYLSQKTNRASAQGDFGGASAASRQALWLAALSILFGVVTYACAIAALISYLSGKPP